MTDDDWGDLQTRLEWRLGRWASLREFWRRERFGPEYPFVQQAVREFHRIYSRLKRVKWAREAEAPGWPLMLAEEECSDG